MAFTVYNSSDAGAPTLSGSAGDLIGVLDACLVDGFGAKVAAGWSHPVATASNIASYQQGSGCGFGLVINDNGPNVTSTYKEAWATGWESVAGVGAPVGTGSGQFPTPAQLLTTGHTVIRKSATADATTRDWMVYADDATFILFIHSGDSVTLWGMFVFGDIYSLAGVADAYRCIILGRANENAAESTVGIAGSTALLGTAVAGHFIARTWGGTGSSITVGKFGDASKAPAATYLDGLVQTPNGPDTAYYLSPLWIGETGGVVRGRLRGLYHICHPRASFSDGQTFSGANDYLGKTFEVRKSIGTGGTTDLCIAVETSNTLETNS
jgi:hypothetical protein